MTKQFKKVQEDFICEMCGAKVSGNGYTNHCPECLTSKHVDINPGDRACDCHGLMPAVGLDTKNGEFRWVKSAGYDASYENFTRYMRMVFAYANTFSMDAFEAKSIDMANIQIGDIWLEGGSPGHAMMVVDICFDENGNKAFLLAQGHMPAQEFEVMNNPLHPDDPWYYEEEVTYPFITDVHEFGVGSLQRLNYFP